MRAAYLPRPAASGVLTVGEVETPEPGPGEVRVRVDGRRRQPDRLEVARGPAAAPFDFQVPGPGRRGRDRRGRRRACDRGAGGRARVGLLRRLAAPVGDGGAVLRRAGPSRPCRCRRRVVRAGRVAGHPRPDRLPLPARRRPDRGHDVLVAGGAGAVGHAAIELRAVAGARGDRDGVRRRRRARWPTARARTWSSTTATTDAAEQIRAAAPDGVDRIVEVALGPNLELDLARRRAARA